MPIRPVPSLALALIHEFEKGPAVDHTPEGDFARYPYKDGGGVLTVGWGHKLLPGDVLQYPLQAADADVILTRDLTIAASAIALGLDPAIYTGLTEGQYAALIAFVFNVGATAFSKSHLRSDLNAGQIALAGAEFPRWNHDNGQVVAGLTRRRAWERTVFETGALPKAA